MNGAVMNSLFHTNIRQPLIVLFLIIASTLVANAQDSRIQTASLDHLAAKASQSVDVNVDERLMKMAAKVFSDQDVDERKVKKLVEGLKGIYVRSFEFDTSGQYTDADLESIRTQLRGPGWTRMVNVTSKKDGKLEVYLLFQGEQVGGLAVLHSDEKELTVVNIVGPVNLDKLAELEGQLGVPELGIESPKPKTKNDEN
ncbi:MAG TPA: DUF4252 domain-containing protein [Pyrinomonadaceae bacterium]|nr:DUF4252 domain-containing protein [Pyrinomonadaceae bacterium]